MSLAKVNAIVTVAKAHSQRITWRARFNPVQPIVYELYLFPTAVPASPTPGFVDNGGPRLPWVCGRDGHIHKVLVGTEWGGEFKK